jgi:hypothetical protein
MTDINKLLTIGDKMLPSNIQNRQRITNWHLTIDYNDYNDFVFSFIF